MNGFSDSRIRGTPRAIIQRRASVHVVSLLLCLVLTGCLSFGKKVAESRFSAIHEGISTKMEVERLLGKPTEVTHSDGRTLYIYTHTRLRPYAAGYGSAGIRMTVCSVLLEANGIVLKKLLSTGDQTMKSTALGLSAKTLKTFPLQPTDLIRGSTTYAETKKIYGEPYYSVLTLTGGTVRTWQSGASENIVKFRVRELTVWFTESDVIEDFAVTEAVE